MAKTGILRCHKCHYAVLDEDVHTCKNCNEMIKGYDSRWESPKGKILKTPITWEA